MQEVSKTVCLVSEKEQLWKSGGKKHFGNTFIIYESIKFCGLTISNYFADFCSLMLLEFVEISYLLIFYLVGRQPKHENKYTMNVNECTKVKFIF